MLCNWTNACIMQVDSRNNFILAGLYIHINCPKRTHLADTIFYWFTASLNMNRSWDSQLLIRLSLWSLKWILVVWIKQDWNKCPFMSCCFVFDWNWSTPEFSRLLLGILIYYYHAQYIYEDSKLLVPFSASTYRWVT